VRSNPQVVQVGLLGIVSSPRHLQRHVKEEKNTRSPGTPAHTCPEPQVLREFCGWDTTIPEWDTNTRMLISTIRVFGSHSGMVCGDVGWVEG
jgi:hypothetical protein